MRVLSIPLFALLVFCMGCATEPDSPASSEAASLASTDTLALPATDAADPSITLERLQGMWQSIEDPAYIVQFTGDRFIEAYNGEPITDEPVRLANECTEEISEASDDYFLVVADVCYVMLDLTATSLSYSMVGGRGNTLAFERSDAF